MLVKTLKKTNHRERENQPSGKGIPHQHEEGVELCKTP